MATLLFFLGMCFVIGFAKRWFEIQEQRRLDAEAEQRRAAKTHA